MNPIIISSQTNNIKKQFNVNQNQSIDVKDQHMSSNVKEQNLNKNIDNQQKQAKNIQTNQYLPDLLNKKNKNNDNNLNNNNIHTNNKNKNRLFGFQIPKILQQDNQSQSSLQNNNNKNKKIKLQQQYSQQKQTNYYQQFCKLYLANAVLQTHLKQLAMQKSQLIGKLNKLQKKAQQNNDGLSSNQQRKKRIRRSAADIARHYKCSHQNCSKSYGSQGSLNQHIKLKHPDLFKTLNIPDSMIFKSFEDDDSENQRSQFQDGFSTQKKV